MLVDHHKGIEPLLSAWKAGVLPLHQWWIGGEKSEIRTRTNSATNCRATLTLITPYWLLSRELNSNERTYEARLGTDHPSNIGFGRQNRTGVGKVMSLTWEPTPFPLELMKGLEPLTP